LVEPAQTANRDPAVDLVRGLAVFIMVGANMAPVLPPPHPFPYRLYASLAAPLFITLAGMMVGLTGPERPLAYFLKRGAFIIAVGAVLDLAAWGLLPFLGFNVLYLIGLSLPLAALARRLNAKLLIIPAVVIFSLTPLLQSTWGYAPVPLEISLQEPLALSWGQAQRILRQWLVDGYFPVFPWTGFIFFGLVLARRRWGSAPGPTLISWMRGDLGFGAILIAAGAILWFFRPGPLYERHGYVELFYPAAPGFILTMLGWTMLIIGLLDRTRTWPGWEILTPLGRASLAMYVFHEMVLVRLVFPVWPKLSWPGFIAAFTGLISAMIWLGLVLSQIKAHWKRRPLLFRFLLGG